MRIAVLDTGVTEEYRSHLKFAVAIDETGIVRDQPGLSGSTFAHGTVCLAIIRKYFGQAELGSMQILDETGQGAVNKLAPAFEWCLKQEIDIVNVSFGTTNFRDAEGLRRLTEDYAARGLLIIAAAANSGYTTYPASFDSVIGVACIEKALGSRRATVQGEDRDFAGRCLKSGNLHTGVDILAPSIHTVKLEGRLTASVQSNSYAAPFVTAWAGTLLQKYPDMRAEELREKMRSALSDAPSPPVRHEGGVPVVILLAADGEMVSELTKQICCLFREDGYHAYAVWTDGKQVLCGENRHPMEFATSGSQWEALRDFIRGELYYKCCDILIVIAEKKCTDVLKAGMDDADICWEMDSIYHGEKGKIGRLYRHLLAQLTRA